ncbi:MAG: HAD-IIIC family phosphatase [Kofleriaceae bacterium]|nr:HAD-IIIC family phosphatase [Kofleriaceae bacterium]
MPVSLFERLRGPDGVTGLPEETVKLLLEHGLLSAESDDEGAIAARLRPRLHTFHGALPTLGPAPIAPPLGDGAASDDPLQPSAHLRALTIDDDNVFVVHPFLGAFVALSRRTWDAVQALRAEPVSARRFAELHATTIGARGAARLLEFLRDKRILFASAAEEAAAILAANPRPAAAAMGPALISAEHVWRQHCTPAVDLVSFAPPTPLYEYDLPPTTRKLRICMIGNCVVQLAMRSVEQAAYRCGFSGVEVTSQFDIEERPGKIAAELVVAGHNVLDMILGRRADGLLDDAQWEKRVALVKAWWGMTIKRLKALATDKLVLIVGSALPAASPLGRAGYRRSWDLRAVIEEVNRYVRELTAGHPNMMYVDVEQVFADHGKARIRDEWVAPYRHEGYLDESTAAHPGARSLRESLPDAFASQPGAALRLLAQEILDCYVVWKLQNPVKLVVVDLDNTLWRGVAGEAGEAGAADFGYGALGGLHEALNVLRQRGIPLVTCSKNTEEVSLGHWELRVIAPLRDDPTAALLRPDDFVCHKISWDRKSVAIRQICDELSLRLGSVLFIDDNPIERHEVVTSLPAVRVLGHDLNQARRTLLRDPHLQQLEYSAESQQRPAMYKAQLKRAADAAVMDEGDFLRSLGIKLEIEDVRGIEQLGRITELVQRTNQFNTTHRRYDAMSLRAIIEHPEHRVFTLTVADRYSEHGLVGCCVVTDRIELIALSCRVLALKVATTWLAESFRRMAPVGALVGLLTEQEVNRPCHDVFEQLGFERRAPDWVLNDLARLPATDPEIHTVVWR